MNGRQHPVATDRRNGETDDDPNQREYGLKTGLAHRPNGQ